MRFPQEGHFVAWSERATAACGAIEIGAMCGLEPFIPATGFTSARESATVISVLVTWVTQHVTRGAQAQLSFTIAAFSNVAKLTHAR